MRGYLRAEEEVEISYSVCARSLDSFFFKYILRDSPKFAIWVDVEGLCLDVIVGAQEVLKITQIIKVEVESYEAWKGRALDKEVLSALTDIGFVELCRSPEASGQYDVVFVRSAIFDLAQAELQ